MQITLKDLSKKLGMAPSTISRALKDHPDISDETKAIVKKLAAELNYVPNAIALSLRSRKSNLIAVIVPEIAHHFFSTIISSIEQVAVQEGFNVILFQSNEDVVREISICRTIKNSGMGGVMVSLSKNTRSTEHFQQLKEDGIPVVFFDRIAGDIDTDRVVVDDFKGAYTAVEQLIANGCRRILHLAAPQYIQIAQKRKMGYVQALVDNHIPVDEKLIIPCDNMEDAMRMTEALMAEYHPDGIFAVNDMAAVGVLYRLRRLGYRIPEDVALCGFSNDLISSLTEPSLTTVEQEGKKIGKAAVRLLLRRIRSRISYPTITQVIKTSLIVRESSEKNVFREI